MDGCRLLSHFLVRFEDSFTRCFGSSFKTTSRELRVGATGFIQNIDQNSGAVAVQPAFGFRNRVAADGIDQLRPSSKSALSTISTPGAPLHPE